MEARGISTALGSLNRLIRALNDMKERAKNLLQWSLFRESQLMERMVFLHQPTLADYLRNYCDKRNAVAESYAYGTQKAKNTNLKQFAETIRFLEEQDLSLIHIYTLILGRRNLLRVDSDDLSIRVDQRTARVARVDGSIGLDAVDGAAAGGGDWTVDRRHISHCQGACQLQSARVADGDNLLTDLHLVRVSKFCRSQSGSIDLQNRKVGLFIRADHGGIVFAAVSYTHLDVYKRQP